MNTPRRVISFLVILLLNIHFSQAVTPIENLKSQLSKLNIKTNSFVYQNKFQGVNFEIEKGIPAKWVAPEKSAPGNPWLWRAYFWGHQPALDIALLEKGYHLAYCDVIDLFGAPQAVVRWNKFYKHSQQIEMHAKPVLEGMSRGGLMIFNWAKANPDKVSAIYGDNPVCDINSWPRKRSERDWNLCKKVYNIDDNNLEQFKGNPIDGLEKLAKAQVPIFLVLGEADSVVPIKDNALLLKERYERLGGQVRVWLKPGAEHHPHGLNPVQPLAEALHKAVNP